MHLKILSTFGHDMFIQSFITLHETIFLAETDVAFTVKDICYDFVSVRRLIYKRKRKKQIPVTS